MHFLCIFYEQQTSVMDVIDHWSPFSWPEVLQFQQRILEDAWYRIKLCAMNDASLASESSLYSPNVMHFLNGMTVV